jgi:hypothetical protein
MNVFGGLSAAQRYTTRSAESIKIQRVSLFARPDVRQAIDDARSFQFLAFPRNFVYNNSEKIQSHRLYAHYDCDYLHQDRIERLADRLNVANDHLIFLNCDIDGNQSLSEMIDRILKQKGVMRMQATRGILSQVVTSRQASLEAALMSVTASFHIPILWRSR